MFTALDQNWIRSTLYQLETFDREDKDYHWKKEYEVKRRSKWNFKATQSWNLPISLSLNEKQIKDRQSGTLSSLFVPLLDTKNRCAAYRKRLRTISCETKIVLLSHSPEENKRGRMDRV